jgi:hypothetical protein
MAELPAIGVGLFVGVGLEVRVGVAVGVNFFVGVGVGVLSLRIRSLGVGVGVFWILTEPVISLGGGVTSRAVFCGVGVGVSDRSERCTVVEVVVEE